MPHNKSYWQLLSSVYFYLNEDREAVATLSAAYHNGLFSQPDELLHLVRFYLFAEVPHKAARVLKQALNQQQIEKTLEHLELLADSWL